MRGVAQRIRGDGQRSLAREWGLVNKLVPLELDAERARRAGRPSYAIVDIGSNSVRLVVYEQHWFAATALPKNVLVIDDANEEWRPRPTNCSESSSRYTDGGGETQRGHPEKGRLRERRLARVI
jgi:hypothetical protein